MGFLWNPIWFIRIRNPPNKELRIVLDCQFHVALGNVLHLCNHFMYWPRQATVAHNRYSSHSLFSNDMLARLTNLIARRPQGQLLLNMGLDGVAMLMLSNAVITAESQAAPRQVELGEWIVRRAPG